MEIFWGKKKRFFVKPKRYSERRTWCCSVQFTGFIECFFPLRCTRTIWFFSCWARFGPALISLAMRSLVIYHDLDSSGLSMCCQSFTDLPMRLITAVEENCRKPGEICVAEIFVEVSFCLKSCFTFPHISIWKIPAYFIWPFKNQFP